MSRTWFARKRQGRRPRRRRRLSSLLASRREADPVESEEDNDENEEKQASLPLLYCLAQRWAWTPVLFRCQTHPHEATSVDANGDTALHWCVFGRPPVEVVQALLDVAPQLVETRNDQGLLPLHVACSYRASAAVLRVLVAACPDAAQDVGGDSYPTHQLCCHQGSSDLERLRVLLETRQGVSTLHMKEPSSSKTPLQLLWRGDGEEMPFRRIHLIRLREARGQQRERLEQGQVDAVRDEQLEETVATCRNLPLWQTSSLFLYAMHRGEAAADSLSNHENPTDAQILHACVALAAVHSPHASPMMRDLAEFAILLLQDDLLTPDPETGYLPLHVVASADQAHAYVASNLLVQILRANPEAATVRCNRGLLPLALADNVSLSSRSRHLYPQDRVVWTWVAIRELFLAHPFALTELKDLHEGLYARIFSRLMRPTRNTAATMVYPVVCAVVPTLSCCRKDKPTSPPPEPSA